MIVEIPAQWIHAVIGSIMTFMAIFLAVTGIQALVRDKLYFGAITCFVLCALFLFIAIIIIMNINFVIRR